MGSPFQVLKRMTQAWDFINADVLWNREQTILGKSLDNFEFSLRTKNVLKNYSLKTVGELVNCRDYELMRHPNFGRKSLEEVQIFLNQYGLTLRPHYGDVSCVSN